MTTLDIYKAHYKEICSQHDDKYSKYEWAADYIFDLTTYDADLDEKFVKDILEVCEVIADRYNFEYIEKNDNYTKYILVCQLLDHFKWIDWGTSIRGAWFDNLSNDRKDILEEYPIWFRDEKTGALNKCVFGAVPFSYDNLKTLFKFMKEE